MDSYKRIRDNSITLSANSLDTLKRELELHLNHMSSRKPKDITLQSQKIPMGVSGTVHPDEELSSIMAFPLAGTLQDFMSFIPSGTKDIFVQVTAVSNVGSQRVETRLMDAFRVYPTLNAQVGATSYVKVTVSNKSKVAVDCVVGFTFKEVMQNEIKATRLIGDLESGSLA